jgi:hypothetical protein
LKVWRPRWLLSQAASVLSSDRSTAVAINILLQIQT